MGRFCAVLLIVTMGLRPLWAQAAAEAIAGQDDPAFQAAVADWLGDEEALALPVLAGLAEGDNRAAQVLLGMIDKGVSLQGPYLSGLTRDARVALMRAPGGISGTNWLRAATAVPLAALWLRLWDISAQPAIVLEFARAGEPRAARVAVLALRARQERGLEAVAGDPDYPASMRFAQWEAALPAAGAEALSVRATTESAGLSPGDPQRQMAGIDDGAAREAWFQAAEVAEPVDALCLSLCPETYDTCTVAALGAVGGYRGLVTLGSPVEALVDTPTYAASAKGRSDLLRRALLRWPVGGRAGFMARAAALDQCFGAALDAEAARY